MRGSREDVVEWRNSAAFWNDRTLDATVPVAGKTGLGVVSNQAQRVIRRVVH
jgi:hypothetical protein